MKKILMGGLTVLLCVAAHSAESRNDNAPGTLPLRDVVLFSSGVGYFGRDGQVSGDGANGVELSFRAEQINDILKSLVVLDPQGQVRPVTYTTKDALGRRLRGAGRSLDGTVSLGALLRQFQGARVRVSSRGGTYEGRIVSVSVETVQLPKSENTVSREILNLMTERGLVAIPLEGATNLQFLDVRLDREFRQNLELLSGGLNDESRSVKINFGPGAPRQVRVGYLQETPVWKTTYRLVLDAAGAPYLQGWGIVENTTDEDWQNVHLSLVSGRPISFIQDLYQPLYVPRPVVAPQVIGSPMPQTYGETLSLSEEEVVAEAAPAADRRAKSQPGARGPSGAPGAFGGEGGGFGGNAQNDMLAEGIARRRDSGLSAGQLADGATALAQGGERGELFEYAIAQPVNLARQQAAMVPIIGKAVEGERLSIFDAQAGERALLGLRLKNTTGLHLAGGPITVFREGIYAGDAQMTNLQPDEERLISYAVDLDLVTGRKQPIFRRETVSFSARNGVLIIRHREFRDIVYTFRNKGRDAKTVLVQQPIEADFTVVEPKAAPEKTAQQYRFKVPVAAGQSVDFKVVSERPVMETLALVDLDLNLLVSYARNAQLTPPLRTALEDLVARRRKITDAQNELARVEREIADIDAEQSRIRQNMDRLDRQSALYKQYVEKLTAQEKRVGELAEQRAKLRDANVEAQKQLRAFVDALTIE